MKKESNKTFKEVDEILKETLKIESNLILPKKFLLRNNKPKSLISFSIFKIPLTIIFSIVLSLFFKLYDLIFETSFFTVIKENILIFLILIKANFLFECFMKNYSNKIIKNNHVDFFDSKDTLKEI